MFPIKTDLCVLFCIFEKAGWEKRKKITKEELGRDDARAYKFKVGNLGQEVGVVPGGHEPQGKEWRPSSIWQLRTRRH